MGCTGSSEIPDDAYKKSNDNPQESGCFTDEYFNQDQKRLVKDSWKLVDNNREEKGVAIFLRIFEKRPDAKKLFPFRDLEGKELLKNSRFRGHSKRFMNAVGSTVDNLDALDVSCAPTLLQLGHRHAMVANFMNSYMDTFVESIQEVFENELGSEETPQVKQAWNAVFRFITSKIEEGYQDALSKQKLQQQQLNPDHHQTDAVKADSVIENDFQSDSNTAIHVNDITLLYPIETKEDGHIVKITENLVLNQTNGLNGNGTNHCTPTPIMENHVSGDQSYVIENKQITDSISTEQTTNTDVL